MINIESLFEGRKYFPVEISKSLSQLKRLENPTDDILALEKKYETNEWVEIFNTQEDFALSLCEKDTWVDRRQYMTMMQ